MSSKNKEIIHWGSEEFVPKNYQQCALTVMDNIADPFIKFNKDRVCNYVEDYEKVKVSEPWIDNNGIKKEKLDTAIAKLRSVKGEYNCILGVSGGVDSTYLAYFLKEAGLNVLLVHFDNGWNSELAVKNIENIVAKTGFDLETYVMEWDEFKDIQRSYFFSSVLDLEVPTDHMIFGALYKIANKYKIKYVVSGNNVVTEWLIPKAWNYSKFDAVNMNAIQNKFGTLKLKRLPQLGVWQYAYYQLFLRIEKFNILDFIPYNKAEVKEVIKSELGWVDYGGKHYESIFTRFYQGYILPKKFGIDKRKAHLSNLILSNQLTKEEALKELKTAPMPELLAKQDKEYVAKKLDFTVEEFEKVLTLPNVDHQFYGTDYEQRQFYFSIMKLLKPITKLLK
jgi:N-acetyl sugar amidotransferase